ncbi:MAG: TetR/AcrR family transcriptional regulator [Crocinitomicaceae bacterium]|jgi:AcrR family transcriptional regulator|nr:TetR/AcrR family transcriptional regulator [Crocinitomicaceae bacterium]
MRIRDEKKECNIREKALELIVKQGFDGFSMQKLAKQACVSPATLYIYYDNKAHLVNALYNHWHDIFIAHTLKGFDVDSSFEEGLWRQWINRWSFITEFPLAFRFLEQFRHSPHVLHESVSMYDFKDTMRTFLRNVVEKGEMIAIEPELYWSLAYGPLYAVAKFHFTGKSFMNREFHLSEKDLRILFNQAIKSLKK